MHVLFWKPYFEERRKHGFDAFMLKMKEHM